MRIYAESSVFQVGVLGPDGKNIVVEVPSSSNPDKKYRVDLTQGRCSCPAWIHQKAGRKPCKHLRALGFYDYTQIVEVAEPVATKAKVKATENELL